MSASFVRTQTGAARGQGCDFPRQNKIICRASALRNTSVALRNSTTNTRSNNEVRGCVQAQLQGSSRSAVEAFFPHEGNSQVGT